MATFTPATTTCSSVGLTAVLKEGAVSPIGPDIATFLGAAEQLGYSLRAREAMASQAPVRMLIESGHRLDELCDEDFEAFEAALSERELRHGRDYKHYRIALYATRAVLYHLGAPVAQVPQRSVPERWSWDRHLDGRQRGTASVHGRLPRTPLGHPDPFSGHGDGLRARPFRTVPDVDRPRSVQLL